MLPFFGGLLIDSITEESGFSSLLPAAPPNRRALCQIWRPKIRPADGLISGALTSSLRVEAHQPQEAEVANWLYWHMQDTTCRW